MALITCKHCEKEFSSDAKRCPNCGAKKRYNRKILKGIMTFVVMSWVGAALLGVISSITATHALPASGISAQRPISVADKKLGKIIDKMYAAGVVSKIDAYSNFIEVTIRPVFYSMDYDAKLNMAKILCAYYSNKNGNPTSVYFLDSRTNKRIGEFGVAGLQLGQ
jgi:hypothetical protein